MLLPTRTASQALCLRDISLLVDTLTIGNTYVLNLVLMYRHISNTPMAWSDAHVGPYASARLEMSKAGTISCHSPPDYDSSEIDGTSYPCREMQLPAWEIVDDAKECQNHLHLPITSDSR
jgi:hypothetical protein